MMGVQSSCANVSESVAFWKKAQFCSLRNVVGKTAFFKGLKCYGRILESTEDVKYKAMLHLRSTALPSQANTGQYQPKKYVHCQQSCCHNSRYPIWQTRRLAIAPLTLFHPLLAFWLAAQDKHLIRLYQAVCQARMTGNISVFLTS